MQAAKDPGIAAVLSCLCTGLGQIYNGEILKGIVLICRGQAMTPLEDQIAKVRDLRVELEAVWRQLSMHLWLWSQTTMSMEVKFGSGRGPS